MSTEFPSKNGINRQWHVIDAEDVVLGKLASKAAMMLMGKTQTQSTRRFIDTGDHVIVINAAKVTADGPEGRRQSFIAISPGIPADWWKRACKRVRADAPDPDGGRGHLGHASEDQAGQADVPETEGLRG